MPLTVGNEWIYERSYYHVVDDSTSFLRFDTLRVIGDTIIDGNEYAVLNNTYLSLGNSYLRDSAAFILDENNEIFFTTDNSLETATYYEDLPMSSSTDTLWLAYFKLDEINNAIYVPAGIFLTHNYKGCFFTPLSNPPFTELFTNKYLAKDIGLIKQSNSFASGNLVLLRELVSYTLVE